MQLEFTVLGDNGAARDVRVTAPDDTPLWAIVEQLRPACPGAASGLWVESRRLPFDGTLAELALPTGTTITTGGARPTNIPAMLPATDALVRLHIVGGPEAGRIEALPAGETIIGRSPGSGLVLRDPLISRRHAALSVTAGGVHIRDLGSTNGIRVDGADVDHGGSQLQPDAHVQIGDSTLSVSVGGPLSVTARPGPNGTVLLRRGPRPITATTESTLVEPVAPDRARRHRPQLLTAVLPALAGAAIALVTHQLLFLAFAVAGPAALVVSSVIERRRQRRDERTTGSRLRQLQDEAATELAARLATEVRVRRASHPDAAAIRRAVATRNAVIWQRRRDDPCFLEVRVGLADQLSRLRVRRSNGDLSPAETVASVPVTLPLRLAPIGICGPRDPSLALARWLVGQLAALHSPADLALALVGSGDPATWSWLRRLPHYQRATSRDAHPLLPRPGHASLTTGRWTVLVIDDPSTADLEAVARALEPGCPNQVSAIWLGENPWDRPSTSVVSVVGETGSRLRVEAAVGLTGPDANDRECIADQVSREWAQSVSRHLMPLRDAGAADATLLPDECRLHDLPGPTPCSSAAIIEQWRRGGRPVATLGVGVDGPLTIDLVKDGPHMLVAGTTGAGKSELLRTLVTGLAITNSPADLSFILIDYKGGAAFADCAQLPHTVGFVTDLDAQLAKRALASLQAELRRREGLLAAAGVADLHAYRSAPAHQGEPLGRLVIVVDEFATLADELPDLISGLLAVARRGRSLGLHLVLATQRPAGAISPEMQANLALRIALRVTDPAESMAIIGSAAAAGIDQSRPGRAIVRAGVRVDEFQTARVGRPERSDGDELRVELLDDWGWPVVGPARSEDRPSDLLALIKSMQAALRGVVLTVPPSPWLPPLPNSVTLGDLAHGGRADQIAIGLLDEPDIQQQSTETIDLDHGGALLIAGPARSGRTTALRTIAHAARAQLTVTQLQLYALDCAGGGLAGLADGPHCGAMLTAHEPDAIGRLVNRLRDEVAQRQQRAVADPANPIQPRLLLLIDGWESLVDAIDAVRADEPISVVDRLLGLLRDAPSSHLTIAITAGSTNLTSRVTASIQRTFRLGDSAGADAGRATRFPGGNQVQFAWPGSARAGDGDEPIAIRPASDRPGPIYVRPLPDRVDRRALAPVALLARAGVVLGLAGDAAEPIAIDLLADDGRWLIAGPARSGRTTLLVSMLHQLVAASIEVVVAAPARSPLSAVAINLGLAVLDPTSTGVEPLTASNRDPRILLIDDSAAYADQALEAQLLEFVASAGSGHRGVVVSARSDDPALGYRGIAAAVRRSGTGILLQPGPVEGELLGVRLPRPRSAAPLGRAVLICDQAQANDLKRGRSALPIQLAY